ncbi:altronate dehydratase family protein [Orrella sp. JC864]|uniref:UxaA family hydrolase n=1 Tax=Orrella sp. JC864 TaxID=3120298 RepID=UPI0030080B94
MTIMINISAARTVKLHPQDNVAVACRPLGKGADTGHDGIRTETAVPLGHKIAIQAIGRDQAVRKYGQVIGFASADILPGQHVHTHNVAMKDFARDYDVGQDLRETALVPPSARARFMGYRRANGKAGTRNYIGILTTVNCSATVARHVAAAIERSGMLARYPGVDGVVALTHGTGCGMADSGEGFAVLQRTLWGYARHPNFAGILILGLGCEVNQIRFLTQAYQLEEHRDFRLLNIQETGGTRSTVEKACAYVEQMLQAAQGWTREPICASELILALQCGGSDGYSGITANPALGHAADLLVRQGGTAILSETPEIYGAEHLLTRRAVSEEVAEKLIGHIRWWEDYTQRNGGQMDNNPSPGNKAGGLTTILEKSLGAVAKGGTTNLTAVYRYAEPVTERGFVFMDSPGFDPASATGQIASGANVLCFTTGRGSVSGFKPVPCIKIASNSAMYERLKEDMDVNCGGIIEGQTTIAQAGQEIFELILRVASGEPSKSEAQGFGDSEFVPWQIGAVM